MLHQLMLRTGLAYDKYKKMKILRQTCMLNAII